MFPKKKNYPAIDSAKIPLVKESYLAFLYWITRKFENENDIVFKFLPIAKFIQEMSKLKIDSDYKERVHEIRFCEKVLKDWDSIMTNYNDTNEIEPRDFVFLDFFKDKIKLCEDWKYCPKMDSLGNIVNF